MPDETEHLRQLDRRVAEEIFDNAAEFHDGNLVHPDVGLPFWVPNYSADIAEAWTVVEAMRERGRLAKNRFADALAEEMRVDSGEHIHWPSAIMYLKPVNIVRAALAAVAD